MYMSCTCLDIMYMLLTFSFPILLPPFHPTMYMFMQNSEKKSHSQIFHICFLSDKEKLISQMLR